MRNPGGQHRVRTPNKTAKENDPPKSGWIFGPVGDGQEATEGFSQENVAAKTTKLFFQPFRVTI